MYPRNVFSNDGRHCYCILMHLSVYWKEICPELTFTKSAEKRLQGKEKKDLFYMRFCDVVNVSVFSSFGEQVRIAGSSLRVFINPKLLCGTWKPHQDILYWPNSLRIDVGAYWRELRKPCFVLERETSLAYFGSRCVSGMSLYMPMSAVNYRIVLTVLVVFTAASRVSAKEWSE